MSALDVLRQIKQARRANQATVKVVEWGNAEYINNVGIENLTRRELRNHLEARDLDTNGTRLELLERLRSSLNDEQLHKFAYTETIETELLIQADLEERGSVYTVGLNNVGQLGLGDMDNRKHFTVIPSLRGIGVEVVSCGVDMTYAVTHEHDVYVWGGGGVGRTGINPALRKKKAEKPMNWLEPQIMPDMAGEECTFVSLGASHCLAIGRGGDCFVWGDNNAGQLGLGNFDNKPIMCINNSFPPVMSVSCGFNHSAILTQSQEVYTWGHAANGRLGIGEAERLGAPEHERFYFPVPTCLKTLERITMVACGNDYTLARGAAGLWSWGNGAGGKLGLGDVYDRLEPVLVPRLRGRTILQVVAGTYHSMAVVQYPPILKGGYLYSWGSGYQGQLGLGAKSVSLEPMIIEYFLCVNTMIRMIAAGATHCLAVTVDGEVYSWGSNQHGQLGR
ncbi:hypothetical protein EON65_11435 [archaeon]|nr:MAG: hypothetical protein EON65_11435 [archaeon]